MNIHNIELQKAIKKSRDEIDYIGIFMYIPVLDKIVYILGVIEECTSKDAIIVIRHCSHKNFNASKFKFDYNLDQVMLAKDALDLMFVGEIL